MALIRDTSTAQLAFQIAEGQPDDFLVLRYRGTEGLCQLYRFEIELATTIESFEFDSAVGKSATLSINTSAGTRFFHGIISRFELTGHSTDQLYFRAELVPKAWLLTHRYNSRIFQDQTVPDIVAAVLEAGGVASDRMRFSLEGSHLPRTYCVQYRETDYNFICRLMEEEGIWWYFEQAPEHHTFVAGDKSGAYKDIDDDPKLPYHPPTGLNIETEHVFRYRMGQCVRPGAVSLTDFNFEDPKLNLEAKSDAGRDTDLEFYDYPGEYGTQADGAALAQLRAEEFESGRIHGVGQSNSYRLGPGRTFELTEHPCESFNRQYLITSVLHQGKGATTRGSGGSIERASLLSSQTHQALVTAQQSTDTSIRDLAKGLLEVVQKLKLGDPTANRALTQWLYHAGQVSRDMGSTAGALGANPLEALTIPNLLEDLVNPGLVDFDAPLYECRFECIPADVEFRPPRVTPWPVMRGSQTARVVGPSGEEIHTDKYGRVKVQFNWDRVGKFDDKSSCWIRVSQGFAGGNYGIMFLPRIGQEVIVDFIEGNPDLPIITGRVYNADHMPPYSLPDEKTKSVIKTRSSKGGGGSNELRFEDLKDKEQILLYGQKDIHIRAQHNRVSTTGCNEHLIVGNDRFEKIKKNYHLKIEEENYNVEVAGDKSLAVGGMMSVSVGGTKSFDVGSDVVDKFGAGHKHDVAMTYALKAGIGVKIEGSTGIELKCGASSIVLTPGAIFITAPLVNINSGSGPPVTPPSAKVTSPEEPEEPAAADTVEHGTDTTYSGGAEPTPAEPAPEVGPQDFPPTEVDEKETTWIEIKLVDEEGEPIPSERYKITLPDGTEKEGSLDANGKARVDGIEPGSCEITFPDLDASAWEKTN
ncbi:MAG: type VI secretion system tip protein VgrG [Planctomycetes bacterium]|nr:type VI secretion system tip protein VgrG [Planctomycetota bacterium]